MAGVACLLMVKPIASLYIWHIRPTLYSDSQLARWPRGVERIDFPHIHC